MNETKASIPELQRRLVFSLLRGAVRLAAYFKLPLKAFEDLARLAYYEELRRRGDTPQAEIASIFQKSLRTVGVLDKQYRGDFLAPEAVVERVRRVEDVFGDRPRTAASAAKALELDADDVGVIVSSLVGAGRLRALPENRFELNHDYLSLVRHDLQSRVDGLNHQLDVVAAAVRTRFTQTNRISMARTISFRARPDEIEAVADDLVRAFRGRVIDAEESGLKQGGHEQYGATLALAPMNHREG